MLYLFFFYYIYYPNQTGETDSRDYRVECISKLYRGYIASHHTLYIHSIYPVIFNYLFFNSSYTRIKKREVRLFFTHLEGFAIPVTGRKTTEIHARYAKPTPPYSRAWENITYPHGHSLCCHDQLRNVAKISRCRKQRQ